MPRTRAAFGAAVVIFIGVVAGCGSTGSEFPGEESISGSSGSSGSFEPGFDPAPVTPVPPCAGLECNQVSCPSGGTTSLSGKVFDPSGTVPLYNALVYVPNAPLDPFVAGITCDRCGTIPSGKPIATALTNSQGAFVLKNVPVGVDVPLVVQIGRWRRKVTLPASQVSRCADASVDAALTRLPRTRAEGDIPKIAITTGGADSLECFVRKLMVDPAEFTNPADGGRVNLFVGKRNNADGAKIDDSTPSAELGLWSSLPELKKYDMVILSCEGAENNSTKSPAARQNLQDYLDAGGRVFASHFHYTWYKNGTGQLPKTASWVGNSDVNTANVSVDTTFAKGIAFSEWLVAVGASTTPGIVPMTELRRNVTKVPGTGMTPDVSRRWLYTTPGGSDETKFYSFNTPIGLPADQQCGRGVYTDIHVSSGDASGGTFPANCTTSGFTEQEKALLFLMMDLASCIQDESKPPTAPPLPAIK